MYGCYDTRLCASILADKRFDHNWNIWGVMDPQLERHFMRLHLSALESTDGETNEWILSLQLDPGGEQYVMISIAPTTSNRFGPNRALITAMSTFSNPCGELEVAHSMSFATCENPTVYRIMSDMQFCGRDLYDFASSRQGRRYL